MFVNLVKPPDIKVKTINNAKLYKGALWWIEGFSFLKVWKEFITGWNMKSGPRYLQEQGRPLPNPNQWITNKTIRSWLLWRITSRVLKVTLTDTIILDRILKIYDIEWRVKNKKIFFRVDESYDHWNKVYKHKMESWPSTHLPGQEWSISCSCGGEGGGLIGTFREKLKNSL